ncbi:hypothetical protein E4T56_gene10242 [Termitomyces sp. T112]|nr:hypothetical protein E4T56_gene10242 [Termitomyces sp. T112]
MSSSAYSPAASPSPSAHTLTSSLEDSEGWRDRRWVQAMYRSQLSAAVAGPSGLTAGEAPAQLAGEMVLASCSRSGMVPGVVRPIPMGSRVTQADVTPEYFAEAAGACPVPGRVSSHKKCSVTLSWHAACIAAEQGWDHEWVAMQLEEGRRGRVSGRGSGSVPLPHNSSSTPPDLPGLAQINLPWLSSQVPSAWNTPKCLVLSPRGQRNLTPTTRDKSKWRVSPSPEVGPSKQAWGELVMAGPPGPMVYSLTSGALVEQSVGGSWLIAKAFLWRWAEELERLLATHREEVCRVGEERDGLRRELDEAWKEWDLAPSRAVSMHKAVGGMGGGGRATIRGVGDAGDSAEAQCGGDPSDGSGKSGLPTRRPQGGGECSTGLGSIAFSSTERQQHWGPSMTGLIGGVYLIPEKLVKGLEVLGDFMGSMGGDVLQGQGESGVVAFVGIEGGDSGGGVGHVVVGRDTALASGSLILFQLPKVGYEQGSAVRDNVVRESMLREYVFKKQFGKLRSIVGGVAGDEEGLLGEAANNDEDHIKTFGIGEFNNMIHQ